MQVSVILPVYNAQYTIFESVSSILNQSYNNLEILIIDDGSSDNTKLILDQFDDPRLRVIHRENRGLGNTLNQLIELSTNELIARMDADDIAHPDRIKSQVNVFKKNKELAILGGQINFLVNNQIFDRADMPLTHDLIRSELLRGRFPICHPAIMFRKDLAQKIGCYRLGGAGEDLDFFLRMSEVGRIYNISNKVLDYRMEMNSLSSMKRDELNKGYAFAIYNANQRMKSDKELNIEEFNVLVWSKRSIHAKLIEWMHNVSEKHYRKYFFHRSKGMFLMVFIDLVVVCAFRPRAFLLYLKSKLFGTS